MHVNDENELVSISVWREWPTSVGKLKMKDSQIIMWSLCYTAVWQMQIIARKRTRQHFVLDLVFQEIFSSAFDPHSTFRWKGKFCIKCNFSFNRCDMLMKTKESDVIITAAVSLRILHPTQHSSLPLSLLFFPFLQTDKGPQKKKSSGIC